MHKDLPLGPSLSPGSAPSDTPGSAPSDMPGSGSAPSETPGSGSAPSETPAGQESKFAGWLVANDDGIVQLVCTHMRTPLQQVQPTDEDSEVANGGTGLGGKGGEEIGEGEGEGKARGGGDVRLIARLLPQGGPLADDDRSMDKYITCMADPLPDHTVFIIHLPEKGSVPEIVSDFPS